MTKKARIKELEAENRRLWEMLSRCFTQLEGKNKPFPLPDWVPPVPPQRPPMPQYPCTDQWWKGMPPGTTIC